MLKKILLGLITMNCIMMWAEINNNQTDEQIEKITIQNENDINIKQDNNPRILSAPDIMITTTHKPNGHPVVARNGSNIYMACEGIYGSYPCIDVYRSTDLGSTWSFVTGWYYSSSSVGAYFPSIAVTPSYVTVTFDKRVNGTTDTLKCARIPINSSTATFYYVDYPKRGESDLASNGSTIYCVYRYTYATNDWDIQFKRSTDGGQTWSSMSTVGGLFPISYAYDMPKIYAVTNTILIAAWHYYYSSSYYIGFSQSTNMGSNWSANLSGSNRCYPDVAGYANTYLMPSITYSGNDLSAVATIRVDRPAFRICHLGGLLSSIYILLA